MAEQAYGITFEYSTDSGSTYTAVGSITDIVPPAVTKETIETTNHGSSGVRSYIGGLVDFGEVSITVQYDPDGTEHNAIRDLAKTANDTVGNYQYKISYNDAGSSTEVFGGIVTGFEQEAPMDDVLSATFTIKVTGSVTYA
jgi:hypothetical protein